MNHTFDERAPLALATEIDAGFDKRVLAEMPAYASRYSDQDLLLGPVALVALRAYFQQRIAELQP